MTIPPVTSPPPQLIQQVQKSAVKGSDGDGDEVKGVDPANDKAKEAAKLAIQSQQVTPGPGSVVPSGQTSGTIVNKTA